MTASTHVLRSADRASGAVTPATVLVVEDDPVQRMAMTLALQARGFRVIGVDRGEAALDVIDVERVDVILLDLGLPDEDGLTICRRLRVFTDTPVVVVSADHLESRVVEALDIGADDYVVKPYRMDELMARVRVAFRRSTSKAATTGLIVGDLRVDTDAMVVLVDGRPVDMSQLQIALLTVLLRNAGRTVTYDSLARALWATNTPIDNRNTLRITMSRIRAAIGTGPKRPVIENLRGMGYRLVVPTVEANA